MALDFDGYLDYLDLGDVLDSATGAAATVMAWVVRDAVGVRHEIISKQDAGTTGWELSILASNIAEVGFFNGSLPVAQSTTTLAAGVLYHVCGVYDPTAGLLRMFINGVQEDTTVTVATGSVNATSLNIGRRPGTATNYFNGEMEDVRVYNRALTANEIQTIFSSRGRDRILVGLLGRWAMTEGFPGSGGARAFNILTIDQITTSTTVTQAYTVPSGISNPVLVVGASAEGTTVGSAEPLSATFAGTPMTRRVSETTTAATNAGCGLFTLAVNPGDSGNVIVVYTAACTGRSLCSLVLANALDSVNVVTSSLNDGGNATATFTTTSASKVCFTQQTTGNMDTATGVSGANHMLVAQIVSAGNGFSGRMGGFYTTIAQAHSGYGFTFGAALNRSSISMLALDLAGPLTVPDCSNSKFAATIVGGATYTENIAVDAAA